MSERCIPRWKRNEAAEIETMFIKNNSLAAGGT